MKNKFRKILFLIAVLFLFVGSVSADTCDVSDTRAFCLVTDSNVHIEIDGRIYFGEGLAEGVHPGVTYFKISEKNEILYCSDGTLSTTGLPSPLSPIDQNCAAKTTNKNSLIFAFEYGYGEYKNQGQYSYNSNYLTGEPIEDYYITQTAVWNFSPPTSSYNLDFWNNGWFSNYDFSAKTFYGISDETVTRISNLINDATAAATATGSLSLTTLNTSMSLTSDEKYYVSDGITIVGKYLSSEIILSVSGIDGAFITTDKNSTSGITSLFDGNSPSVTTTVYIKVPKANITDSQNSLVLNISSKTAFNDSSEIMECHPRVENQQPMVKYNPSYTTLSDSISLNINKNTVKVSKKNIAGEEVPGATLTVKDTSGNVVETWASTTEVKTISLLSGTYVLEETIAPEGYIKSTSKIEFTVDDSGKVLIGGKEISEIIITNEPILVSISKRSIIGSEELENAKLKITDKDGNIVSDVNGNKLEWFSTNEPKEFNLAAGTYILSETIAPEGYELSETTVEFTVTSEGKVLIDGEEVENNLIIFTNTPEPEEIPTGSAVIYVASAMCLISLGISVYFIIKRKKI